MGIMDPNQTIEDAVFSRDEVAALAPSIMTRLNAAREKAGLPPRKFPDGFFRSPGAQET